MAAGTGGRVHGDPADPTDGCLRCRGIGRANTRRRTRNRSINDAHPTPRHRHIRTDLRKPLSGLLFINRMRKYVRLSRYPGVVTDRAVHRSAGSWAARLTVLLGVVVGLFAMHGLPAGAAGAGPSTAMTQPETVSGGHHPSARVASPQLRQMSNGCGMDHANCGAVFRADDGPSAPGARAPVVAVHDGAQADVVSHRVLGPRGPPQVSLTRLCISRT